ncbi:hypothetical protein [Kutzneria chonburiensis]|uniref:Secreted protein n=1 Tax=Kutzneria chonburiensis TaxID=1483604 RepID=A0ABV6MZN3_9PSEU|nr:hypothetical protein [Kutzneria chonburiensis]
MKRVLIAVAATGICLTAAIGMTPVASAAPASSLTVTGNQCTAGGGTVKKFEVLGHVRLVCSGGRYDRQWIKG